MPNVYNTKNIRGLEGNENAEPRILAHDALDLGANGLFAQRIPNTETIGCTLYVGGTFDTIKVILEGSKEPISFRGITAGSFLPILIISVEGVFNENGELIEDFREGEIVALY
jgi:hypothetical protein